MSLLYIYVFIIYFVHIYYYINIQLRHSSWIALYFEGRLQQMRLPYRVRGYRGAPEPAGNAFTRYRRFGPGNAEGRKTLQHLVAQRSPCPLSYCLSACCIVCSSPYALMVQWARKNLSGISCSISLSAHLQSRRPSPSLYGKVHMPPLFYSAESAQIPSDDILQHSSAPF